MVLLLFLLSGASGLLYEVAWYRLVGLAIGNTAPALAAVLAAYMGGLSLGAFLVSRQVPLLRRPLLAYGVIEVLIGLTAAAVPPLLSEISTAEWLWFDGDRQASSILGWTLCFGLILLPCTLMGATLPLIAVVLTRDGETAGESAGKAYATNTAGAFFGCAGAGLVLTPLLGVAQTHAIGVGISVLVGVCSLAWHAMLGASSDSAWHVVRQPSQGVTISSAMDHRATDWTAIVAVVMAGAVAMTYQVAWTRVVTLSIGASVFAFTTVVATFVVGLAAGAAFFSSARFRRRPRLDSADLQLGIGVAALAVLVVLGELPPLLALLVSRLAGDFHLLMLVQFAILLSIFLLPTFLMGGVLPLAVAAWAPRGGGSAESAVARVYGWNTLGAVSGAMLAGLVLVPAVGSRTTLLIAVSVNLIAAICFRLACRRNRLAPRFIARGGLVFAALVVTLVLAPAWNPATLASGPFINARAYAKPGDDLARVRERMQRSLRVEEQIETDAGLVTVAEDLFGPHLRIGGKLEARPFDASQSYLAHLPLALHPNPKRVLLIGYGGGNTLASVLKHPRVEQVDVVEISAPAIQLAARHFDRKGDLADPRVRLTVGDGRLFLQRGLDKFDVIISQPSNPWIPGASSLFTREGYAAMRKRLASGGIVCSWVQGFDLSLGSLQALVAGFAASFPQFDLWEMRSEGDYLLTAGHQSLRLDVVSIDARLRVDSVAGELASEELDIHDAVDLLSYWVANEQGWGRGEMDVGTLNTDDNAYLEYRIPFERYRAPAAGLRSQLLPARGGLDSRVDLDAAQSESERGAMLARLRAIDQSKQVVVRLLASRHQDARTLESLMREIERLNPHDPFAYSAQLRSNRRLREAMQRARGLHRLDD